jgi:hypothetical protein
MTRLILFCAVASWVAQAQPNSSDQPVGRRQTPVAHARVVVVEDRRSVFAFNPDADIVEEMVDRGIISLTGKDGLTAAWRSLVSTQDTVGLKVFCSPGPTGGTRPAVVSAVVKGLLTSGIPGKQIVIWDKQLSDLRAAGFVELADRLGVQVAGSVEEGFDEKAFYESSLLGKLVWGDYEFGRKTDNVGRKSFVSKLLTRRLTKVINITPLLNHNYAQVSGNLYSLALGSVDNTLRFEASNQLNQAIPEIYALAEVGDHVVLNLVDALICQYQGEEHTLMHYSTMLCQVRLSTDPVALDVLSVQELDRQRRLAKAPPVKVSWQMFNNASLLELGISDPRMIDIIKLDTPNKAD